jgi:hypothetical protein
MKSAMKRPDILNEKSNESAMKGPDISMKNPMKVQ